MDKITVYHGTSTLFLETLIGKQENPLLDLDLQSCSKKLFDLAIEHYKFSAMWRLFEKTGLESSGPIALKNMSEKYSESLFSYGDFYVSISKAKASRYASRSKWGSEQLWVINEALNALEKLEPKKIKDIRSQFAGLVEILAGHYEPIVVQFSDLSLKTDSIFMENGKVVEKSILELAQEIPEVEITLRFRACPVDKLKNIWKLSWSDNYDPRYGVATENDFIFHPLDFVKR